MRKVLYLFLVVLMISAVLGTITVAQTEQYKLVWDANIEADLIGYKVYVGTESGVYELLADVGNVIECPFDDSTWADGKYYFVATAYDKHGNESGYSNEVSHEVDHTAPAPPSGCTVIKIP